MFQRFLNPTVIYLRRIQQGLDEARIAALEHESAAEHHAALAHMYRDRVRRLQAEMRAVTEGGESTGNLPSVPMDASAAAQVHRIAPRMSKRDEPFGAAGVAG
ncbi:hypothetical protein [Diaphorobacter sp.]|uniref:hypothetical protein n=1 Tax=Diaphorobacter sp. TaxID=1934310 RepID=UPI0028A7F6E9|nr:hypothetical protein [Diaphorobacter sp.]